MREGHVGLYVGILVHITRAKIDAILVGFFLRIEFERNTPFDKALLSRVLFSVEIVVL